MFGGAVRRKGVQVRGIGLETFYLHFYFKKKGSRQTFIKRKTKHLGWHKMLGRNKRC